jgi:hypothetical protein
MPNYTKGFFIPKNPQKYIGGKDNIVYRSAWELQYMNFLDQHPNVLHWASESIQIPYKNPFTGRATIYVPDFFIVYADKNGKQHSELIEIKPARQAIPEKAITRNDKAAVALNQIKWAAGRAWAKAHGVGFRVLVEADLFSNIK